MHTLLDSKKGLFVCAPRVCVILCMRRRINSQPLSTSAQHRFRSAHSLSCAHGFDLRLNTRPTDEPFSDIYYNRQRASSGGQVQFFSTNVVCAHGFRRCTRTHTLCLISISIRRNFFMRERPFASTETLLYSILHLLEFKIRHTAANTSHKTTFFIMQ